MIKLKGKLEKGKITLIDELPNNVKDGELTIFIEDDQDDIYLFEQTYINDLNNFLKREDL